MTGDPVTVEVTDLSGMALNGPVVDDVARALVAGLLVRAVPGAAEILLTDELADRLLPGVLPDRALRRCDSSDDMARVVEAERIARTRRLAVVDAPDAIRFRHENPENPLPLLLVLLDWCRPNRSDGGRRCSPTPPASASPSSSSATAARHRPPRPRRQGDRHRPRRARAARTLDGVALYRLRADEAVELLGAVNDANHEPDEDDPDWAEPHASITPLTTAANDLRQR